MTFVPSGLPSQGDPGRRQYRPDGKPSGIRGLLRTYFAPLSTAVADHGRRGVAAILIAALISFLPAGLLVWFNHLRFSPVIQLQPGQTVVVKPRRHEHEQRDEQAGDTSLLQIVCEVPASEGPVPLLTDDDPARAEGFMDDSRYVRREQVYLRPVGELPSPFGLLGHPPISAWLPPGEYEVLVTYDSPRGFNDVERGIIGFPFVTAAEICKTENRQKTVCRVSLPHYEPSFAERLGTIGADGRPVDKGFSDADLHELLKSIELASAIPTPAGYLFDPAEPAIRHQDDHRNCSFDYSERGRAPREWTRDQLATLRDWLPADDTARLAREKLQGLVDAIAWREWLQGWYLYAAAGIAGLVFTRWGATAVIWPGRRAETFYQSLKTMIAVFLLAAGLWLLGTILTDSGGCHGPVPFRVG